MRVTVAMCTWNRAGLLKQALDSLRNLDVPQGTAWELIVVDNNSTDDTEGVVRSFWTDLPVRYEREERQGKSHALNRAVSVARGEYIAWTDDDAKVGAGWLRAYLDAFAQWPEAALFGGPIRPWFDPEPPEWLRKVLPLVEAAYALTDFGTEPMEFTPERLPYGVNMATRTEDQRRFPYDTRLGPRPNRQLRGEETIMARSMLKCGLNGIWVPDAVVHHHVPAERQTTQYLRAYYRGLGEFTAFSQPFEGARLFGKPRWLWRSAILNEALYRVKRVFGRPEGWIRHLIRSSRAWGHLFGSSSRLR